MCQINPRVILRNHFLHRIIKTATEGDLSLLKKAEELISRPFDDWPQYEDLLSTAPEWAQSQDVAMNSCSS